MADKNGRTNADGKRRVPDGADTGCADPSAWLRAIPKGADASCTDVAAWWKAARRLSGG